MSAWVDMPNDGEAKVGGERGRSDDLTAREDGARPSTGLAILLVDDHPLTREILVTVLADRGHRVTAVCDGTAALDAVAVGGRFDVIVMDVRISGMSGFDLTAALRRQERADARPRVPIIGLMSNATAQDGARGLPAGMDAQVATPVDWPVLFAALNDVVTHANGSAPPSGPTVLDETKLRRLAGGMGRAAIADLLSHFNLDLGERLLAIEADLPRVEVDQVHAIRGMAGLLGFEELADLCAEIEAEARAGRHTAGLRALRDAVDRAQAAARASGYAAP